MSALTMMSMSWPDLFEGSLDGGGDSAPGDDGLDVLAGLADDVPGDVAAHVGVHVLALQLASPPLSRLEGSLYLMPTSAPMKGMWNCLKPDRLRSSTCLLALTPKASM